MSQNQVDISNIQDMEKIPSAYEKSYMTVPEMRQLLGLKKTESYWLVHREFFKTEVIAGQMRIDIESFEKWYANQVKHRKVNGEEPGKDLKEFSYSVYDMADILNIKPYEVYQIWKENEFETFTVDFVKRIYIDEFEWWYASQTKYRKQEVQRQEVDIVKNSVTMPEFGRMIGVGRSTVYSILRSKEYGPMFEIIKIGDRKRVMLPSIQRFLDSQEKYHLVEETEKEPIKESERQFPLTLAPKAVASKDSIVTKRFLNREEAASYCGVGITTIHRWHKKGLLKQTAFGGRRLYSIQDLQSCLEKMKED